MNINVLRCIGSLLLCCFLLVGVHSSTAFADGGWGSRTDDDRVIIEGYNRVKPSRGADIAPTTSEASVVSGVGWEEWWRERVAKCEVLKISGGWDSDPDCMGITWEPDPVDSEPGGSVDVPSGAQIIEYATATVQAKPAGLVVQPSTRALVSVPTLVHATTPTQILSTSLLGQPIVVTLQATSYSFDFGDGTPALVTSDPGGSYPDMTNQHTYTRPHQNIVVTLTTTWQGSVTSPFTGATTTIDGAVVTTETSPPFNVDKARIYTTDTAEHQAGH